MPSIAPLAALASFAGLAFASPVKNIEKRAASTFRISEIQRGKSLNVGALALRKAYQKYGKIVPPKVEAAVSGISGSVIANAEQYDMEYLCPVSVGDATFHLDFDTGSADLWVCSDQLLDTQRGSHPLYRTSPSKQLKDQSWSILYEDRSGASGLVYADKVVIGSATATSQAVEAATSISDMFQEDAADGLVGLSFGSLNTVRPNKAPTFFDNIKPTLSQALFAADLRRGAAGSYDFGYIDSSKYIGNIAYASVDNSQGLWMFTADGYAIGGKNGSGSITGIADTGTTLLLLDASIVTAYYASVSGALYNDLAVGFVFPCDATLPDFSISVGGETRTVPGSYMNHSPASQVSSSTCFGGIQSNENVGFAIFGDVFLKSQYVVFDQTQGSPRIGFGQQ